MCRHVGVIQRQVRESMQSGMCSAQSLPPRSSLTANTYMALERSLDAVARQVRSSPVLLWMSSVLLTCA